MSAEYNSCSPVNGTRKGNVRDMAMTPALRQELRRTGHVAIRNREGAEHLVSYGFHPDVIADVGVDSGTPGLYQAFPDTQFVLIDPRPEVADELKSCPKHYQLVNCAAGKAKAEMELRIPITHKGRKTAMAGFREITGAMGRNVQDIETYMVPVSPLDDIMAAYPGRVGLKIDTEGFEAEVIDGASKTLERTDFVILELSLTKRFNGISAPSSIITRLAAYGLELRDILSLPGDGRGGPAPRYVDALFSRWNS